MIVFQILYIIFNGNFNVFIKKIFIEYTLLKLNIKKFPLLFLLFYSWLFVFAFYLMTSPFLNFITGKLPPDISFSGTEFSIFIFSIIHTSWNSSLLYITFTVQLRIEHQLQTINKYNFYLEHSLFISWANFFSLLSKFDIALSSASLIVSHNFSTAFSPSFFIFKTRKIRLFKNLIFSCFLFICNSSYNFILFHR